jgi:hypothetical protein
MLAMVFALLKYRKDALNYASFLVIYESSLVEVLQFAKLEEVPFEGEFLKPSIFS